MTDSPTGKLTHYWADLILKHLYDDRHKREQAFADAVNHLQCLLIDDNFDDKPYAQRLVLEANIVRLLSGEVVTDKVCKDITALLMKAGWDVFRETR